MKPVDVLVERALFKLIYFSCFLLRNGLEYVLLLSSLDEKEKSIIYSFERICIIVKVTVEVETTRHGRNS